MNLQMGNALPQGWPGAKLCSMSASDPSQVTLHTSPLTPAQATHLRSLLEGRGWSFLSRPHTLYFAQHGKLSLAVYEKGPKVVIQGKGTGEFVQFTLEPEVLGAATLGYEEVLHPEHYAPHFGIDESGKGDFFGPLVIAGAFVDAAIAKKFRDSGIQDSKRIGSDRKIRDLAELIRNTPGATHSVVAIGPERYNQLYKKFGNLNRLLAWGHARVLENLLEQRPDCPRALSDQFANPALVKNALLERGRGIQLDQQTKAESDPAVAAASILAREQFINWLEKAGSRLGIPLPRGASGEVKSTARRIVEMHGAGFLDSMAKTHFKTAAEVAPENYVRADLPSA
jgi:ribonuclease HIII